MLIDALIYVCLGLLVWLTGLGIIVYICERFYPHVSADKKMIGSFFIVLWPFVLPAVPVWGFLWVIERIAIKHRTRDENRNDEIP